MYLCDVMNTHLPRSLSSLTVSQRCFRAAGSRPEVGSSKNNILGSPIIAMAVLSFLLLPPLTHTHTRAQNYNNKNTRNSRKQSTAVHRIRAATCDHSGSCVRQMYSSVQYTILYVDVSRARIWWQMLLLRGV